MVTGAAHRAGNEHCASPVAAVLDVRGVRDQVVGLVNALAERLGLRLVCEACGAAGSTLCEALLGGGDGERRGGEEHLTEEGGSEHCDEQR